MRNKNRSPSPSPRRRPPPRSSPSPRRGPSPLTHQLPRHRAPSPRLLLLRQGERRCGGCEDGERRRELSASLLPQRPSSPMGGPSSPWPVDLPHRCPLLHHRLPAGEIRHGRSSSPFSPMAGGPPPSFPWLVEVPLLFRWSVELPHGRGCRDPPAMAGVELALLLLWAAVVTTTGLLQSIP